MLVLNARIHLLSKDGERTIEAAQMYNNDGIAYLAKRSNEVVTAVDLPPSTATLRLSKNCAGAAQSIFRSSM
jgi:CO/xanthine dehydrogenase FAD-binding subunit